MASKKNNSKKNNSKKNHKTERSGKGNNGGGNRTKVTAKKKEQFLEALIETGGNVTKTCDMIALPRKTLYEHRKKDKQFAEDWDEAVDKGIDVLEDEAKRRAFEGVQEPIYQKGELMDYVTRYSDTLLIFLLKGHRPKYRERHEITGEGGTPLTVRIVEEKIGN